MNSKNVCLFHSVFDEKMNSGCDWKGVPFSSKGKPCKQAKPNAMVILKEQKCCHVL